MAENFTEDEFAFLRFARFGELPARVLPDQLVALNETDPAPDYTDLGEAARNAAYG